MGKSGHGSRGQAGGACGEPASAVPKGEADVRKRRKFFQSPVVDFLYFLLLAVLYLPARSPFCEASFRIRVGLLVYVASLYGMGFFRGVARGRSRRSQRRGSSEVTPAE